MSKAENVNETTKEDAFEIACEMSNTYVQFRLGP
jgi:hypothetical protein